jgi:hypothetical protein
VVVMATYVIPLEQLGMDDVAKVGGKNASLGEMLQKLTPLGVAVLHDYAAKAADYTTILISLFWITNSKINLLCCIPTIINRYIQIKSK